MTNLTISEFLVKKDEEMSEFLNINASVPNLESDVPCTDGEVSFTQLYYTVLSLLKFKFASEIQFIDSAANIEYFGFEKELLGAELLGCTNANTIISVLNAAEGEGVTKFLESEPSLKEEDIIGLNYIIELDTAKHEIADALSPLYFKIAPSKRDPEYLNRERSFILKDVSTVLECAVEYLNSIHSATLAKKLGNFAVQCNRGYDEF